MELLQHPAVILFIVGSAITFTIWLLRLEGLLKTVERDLIRIEKDFDEHENDNSIHQHEKSLIEFKIQFEKRFDQLGRTVERFDSDMKTSLKDVNSKLDALVIKRTPM